MNKVQVLFFTVLMTLLLSCLCVFADDNTMLLGDANNDKIVNAEDALRILKITAQMEDMGSDFSIRKNDYDNNYKIDARDALGVLKIAAGIEDEIVIDDPQNFYNTINYINGYPENDFISCDLDRNIEYSIEEGINNKSSSSLTGVYIEKYVNGVKEEKCNRLGSEAEDFDKLYWELRWLIEDAKKNNQLETLGKESGEFHEAFVANLSFSGYHYEVYTITEKLKNMHSSVFVYISEKNEMYFFVIRRSDLYTYEENAIVYKYTGEIPENLKYESIGRFYDN